MVMGRAIPTMFCSFRFCSDRCACACLTRRCMCTNEWHQPSGHRDRSRLGNGCSLACAPLSSGGGPCRWLEVVELSRLCRATLHQLLSWSTVSAQIRSSRYAARTAASGTAPVMSEQPQRLACTDCGVKKRDIGGGLSLCGSLYRFPELSRSYSRLHFRRRGCRYASVWRERQTKNPDFQSHVTTYFWDAPHGRGILGQ